ncbi:hypothetical protein MYSTI_04066 [Myxococcus stipitatus DSM 14675]|uniref:Putative restriction endonuclease domain-containing protein n=1 Tax=Myxococcus stipitatus (strain DSM 14675 / JCM 12634 / Mx s8) TaxID=1278073 RepID=L7UCP8_MYXSD|nr:hypothetical protein MYSTI_04066 [Myxococcus stipitatus DSM 14675]
MSRSTDRVRKLPVYHRRGVSHAWLIDPLRYSLEVYRSGPRGWAQVGLYEGSAVVRAEPFAEVPLELGLLWLPRRGASGPRVNPVPPP